jgi:hypothetical protein
VPGAHVGLVDGLLAVYLSRDQRELHAFLPEAEPSRSAVARAAARALADWALRSGHPSIGWSAEEDIPASRGPMAAFLIQAGFQAFGPGFRLRSSEVSAVGAPVGPSVGQGAPRSHSHEGRLAGGRPPGLPEDS